MTHNPSDDDPRAQYAEKVSAEADTFDKALADIRARYDRGELSVRQAADQRVELMERHLSSLRVLRDTYLSDGT